MRAIPPLVSAPLNPIPIAEHFRRSHPPCGHSRGQQQSKTKSKTNSPSKSVWRDQNTLVPIWERLSTLKYGDYTDECLNICQNILNNWILLNIPFLLLILRNCLINPDTPNCSFEARSILSISHNSSTLFNYIDRVRSPPLCESNLYFR